MLFKAASDYLGAKKTINLSYDRNMRIDVYAKSSDNAEEETLLLSYFLDDLDEIATSEMAKKEDSTTPKVSLSFELSRSHILTLSKAEVKIDETVVEEVIPESKKPEDTTEESDDENAEKTEEQEGEAQTENLSDSLDSEVEYITKIVPHTMTTSLNLAIHDARLLTEEQKKDAKGRIKALEKRDSDRAKTDEAKNTYESLIYEFRSWLNESEN